MDESILQIRKDNLRDFPELSSICQNELLIEEVNKQFKLSEFAKLFEMSLSGVPLDQYSLNEESTVITAEADAEDVELF